MSTLLSIASILIWVAGLWVVFIMFKKKGAIHGILGLIFIIYPFFWGLKNFRDPDVKKPMTIWLVGLAVAIVLGIFGSSSSGAEPDAFLPFFI